MAARKTAHLEPDLDWCYTVIDDVSRTFALTVHELNEPLSGEICVGYLLCRIADTIEDSTNIPPAEQIRLLESYHDTLAPSSATTVREFMDDVDEWLPDEPTADWEVVAETPRVIATFDDLPKASQEEIRPQVQEMVQGMTMFIDRYADDGGLRIQTIGELQDYSWYVAGTVGILITGLLTRDTPDGAYENLYELAESFGLLLQFVNMTKDVAVDYKEENNVYVPREVLDEHGLKPEDIPNRTKADAFKPVIRRLAQEAKQYVSDAETWLIEMPKRQGNTLSAWAVPFLLAVGTLREVENRPEDVLVEDGVKVSREEVSALLSAFASETNPSLKQLQEAVQSQPLTNPDAQIG